MAEMLYADGERAEVGDEVALPYIDFGDAEGQITKLFPKSGRAMVAWLDHEVCTKAGDPRKRIASIPVRQLDLVRRDG